jgi:hypothetical protein
LALVSLACSAGAKTPELALERLRAAILQDRPADAFPVLDQPTRWSIESVRAYHGECLEAIARDYPEAVRPTAQARFLDATTGARFLALHEARYHLLAGLRPRIDALTPRDFAVDRYGRWGYTGLGPAWEEAKVRAVHDRDTVLDSARAYAQEAQRR